MKIRTDFVTNSSSSSFIIGKKDDVDVTVESVYQTVRKLYSEMKQKYFDMVDYAKNHYGLNVEIVHKDEFGGRYTIKWNDVENINYDIICDLRSKFFYDIQYADLYDREFDNEWIQCSTYSDYEKYWINKINEASDDDYVFAPFVIFDYSERKPLIRVDLGKEGIEDGEVYPEYDQYSSILDWYYDYVDSAFADEDYKVGMCISRGNYEELKDRIKRENITEDNACLYLLGKVCVYAPDGSPLPSYVQGNLHFISQYGCGHMG